MDESKTEILSPAHPCLRWKREGLLIACGSSWLTMTAQNEMEPHLRLRGKEQLAALDKELLAWRAQSNNSPWRSSRLEHSCGDYLLCGNTNQLEFVFRGLRLEVNAPILCDLSNWLRLCQGKAPTWTDDERLIEVSQRGGDPLLRISRSYGEAQGSILPRFRDEHGEELVTALLRCAATPHDLGTRLLPEFKINNNRLALTPALSASWRLHYRISAGKSRSVELSRSGLVDIARQVQAVRKGE